MKRLIDADAVYKWYLEAFKDRIKPNEIRFSMNDIRDNLENIPTIDAEPVRHGKFIGTEYDGYADGNPVYYEWKCSECGCVFEEEPTYRYCPHCGARMEEE